ARSAFVNMGEPAGILLLIDQHVVGLLGAEAMAPHLHRAVIVVELDVEETLAIGRPDDGAVGFLDDIIKLVPRIPFAHADRKIFGALGVGAPGDEPVVSGVTRAAETEIFVILRERIAIERDAFLSAVARLAAEHFVLATLAIPAEIGERAVRRRDAGIVL